MAQRIFLIYTKKVNFIHIPVSKDTRKVTQNKRYINHLSVQLHFKFKFIVFQWF